MNYDWRIEARKQRNHPITYDSVINKYEFKKNIWTIRGRIIFICNVTVKYKFHTLTMTKL